MGLAVHGAQKARTAARAALGRVAAAPGLLAPLAQAVSHCAGGAPAIKALAAAVRRVCLCGSDRGGGGPVGRK